MRKAFFIGLFILLAMTLFGEDPIRPLQTLVEPKTFFTSEVFYTGMMRYYGKSIRQKVADEINSLGYIQIKKISNGQWETVKKMINRYQHSTGDTYEFSLLTSNYIKYYIVVEFTSSAQYRWLGFSS